jgi:hypothetical protein
LPELAVSGRSTKKNPAFIGRELINQGASTNLVSGSTAPHSGQFRKIDDFRNPVSSEISRNPRAKLVETGFLGPDASALKLSPPVVIRKFYKKNPAKIGRELINQGASTNPLSWEFSRNPDSWIKFFSISLDTAKKTPAPKLVGS